MPKACLDKFWVKCFRSTYGGSRLQIYIYIYVAG